MPSDACPYCGDELLLDLFEVWPEDRAWLFDTCCEGLHEDVLEAMAEVEAERMAGAHQTHRRAVMQQLRSLFAEYGIDIRRAYDSWEDMAWRIDFGLDLVEVEFGEAMAFVDRHHRHNGPLPGWRWGHGVRNGPDLVGVAVVGTPRARMIATREPGTVEVNRVCVREDLDPELTWNACSMLYGAAAREAKGRGYDRIITYTLTEEEGTTLRAAGWTPERRSGGGSWSRQGRRREQRAPTGPKLRWGKRLRPAEQLALAV